VNLLVQGAEQGRLGFANVDLKAFKRKVVETLEKTNNESDQHSCIQLLAKIDLPGLGEAIAPRLIHLSPTLQAQSLRAMLKYPNPDYAPDVNKLMEQNLTLEVKALVLRYLWLSQPQLDVQPLQRYLGATVDPVVRGTAAGLILSRGDSGQRHLAKDILQKMLVGSQEQGRLVSAQALESANDQQMMHTYLPKLLQDESPRVRSAAIEVIGAKHLQDFYPALLKGLYYKSTREAALQALVSLGNEALPLLENLAMDTRKPDFVRLQAWQGMGTIGTSQSLNSLTKQLLSSWGLSRRNLLRVLLKLPAEAGIEAVLENLGCSIITTMIEQEMLLLAQVCAGVVDISNQPIQEPEGQLIISALQDLQGDIIERCFLLMKLLYPTRAIQAAMLNLNSESDKSIAQGLEILDNVLDIPQKQIFINVLEHRSTEDKLGVLSEIVTYEPMAAKERLQVLFTLRHFLSDWALACCFHFARQIRTKVQKRVVMSCLRHPSSFVREAVFAYLQEASPRTCRELLPMLKNDPDPIMAAQVESAISYYSPVP
jgi:HEAT repeat protein